MKGKELYIRPQDVDLVMTALSTAADNFSFRRGNTTKPIADTLYAYAEVLADQKETE